MKERSPEELERIRQGVRPSTETHRLAAANASWVVQRTLVLAFLPRGVPGLGKAAAFASAFLVSAEGLKLLVTAKHVLEDCQGVEDMDWLVVAMPEGSPDMSSVVAVKPFAPVQE